jgi:hypothetical protein
MVVLRDNNKGVTMSEWANRFSDCFIGELRREGYSAEQIAGWVWKPYRVQDLNISGVHRDLDYSKLTLSVAEVEQVLARIGAQEAAAAREFYRQQKIVLVLVPGFTHETLKNLSWHEQIERKDSPHHIVMLKPGWNGEPPQEQIYAQGDGLKLLYLRYPRSNAASQYINQPMFDMLHQSPSLRRWVEQEGRKLFFVGYSYGSPLSLELFAGLNARRFKDEFILKNTRGFLGLCGDIGGSYLADDTLKPDAQLVNIPKLVAFCRRHRWIGKLAGLGTDQLLDDMEGGVRSLGHEERQARIREYAPQLPPQLQYFSISAVSPLQDYRRRWWQFNLDDYTMYRQAQVSQPISIYNDGQVVLDDSLVPAAPQIVPANNIHLGAVRTHHWGVSYKTFNFGNNKFPRPAFYRALMRTIAEADASNPD